MSRAGRLALIAGGAVVTAGVVIVGTTMGECTGPGTALCIAGKDQAIAKMLPRALFLYSLVACAVLIWPRLLRWPRK